MYLCINDSHYTIYYYEISNDLKKQYKYVHHIKEIPKKEGYVTDVKINSDGSFEWVFFKAEKEPTTKELQKENEALKKSSQMSLMTIMQLDKRVIELEKKINELSE